MIMSEQFKYCSFCGASQFERVSMVASESGSIICDDCTPKVLVVHNQAHMNTWQQLKEIRAGVRKLTAQRDAVAPERSLQWRPGFDQTLQTRPNKLHLRRSCEPRLG